MFCYGCHSNFIILAFLSLDAALRSAIIYLVGLLDFIAFVTVPEFNLSGAVLFVLSGISPFRDLCAGIFLLMNAK